VSDYLPDFYALPRIERTLTACSMCRAVVALSGQQGHRDYHRKLSDYLAKRDAMLDELMDLVVRHNAMQPHISITRKST
jgi:hypothetical protein